MIATITARGPALGIRALCTALPYPRATYYRHRHPPGERVPLRRRPARALTPSQQDRVLAVLHEPRFADRAPGQVHAALLDEGTYLCSERTMYRVLAGAGEVRERRDQLRHRRYAAPELLATAPTPGRRGDPRLSADHAAHQDADHRPRSWSQ